MAGYEFRQESKSGGLAHILDEGFGSAGIALCGRRASGITVTHGDPCPACLAVVVEKETEAA